MKDCIFCKIRDGEIPKEFEYKDSDVMVYKDLNPIRDIHFLIVPKKHIKDFMDLTDTKLQTKLFKVVRIMVKKNKLENKGFKVFLNSGGAQIIDHLHIHLTGPWGKNEIIRF